MVNFSSLSLPAMLARTLLALLLLALHLPAAAQVPAWQSAQAVAVATAAATNNSSQVAATAVDAMGNVYLAGAFSNSVALGSTTLISLGGQDIFVAKFNPASNQFVWAQRAGGTNDEQATALAVSGTSVYVTGNYASPTAGFGPAILTNAALNSIDVFVAKLTDSGSTGSFVWAQRAGGLSNEEARALAVSGTSVYVTGNFRSPTASFGATTLNNAGANYSEDIFVAKLTDVGSTGSFVWAQRAGGTEYDYATALAVSGSNVYVTGYFAGPTAIFGPATLTNAESNASDGFVAKLTDAGSTGSFVWAQRAGGTGYDYPYALAVRGSSVYVAGAFESPTAAFGPTTLTNAGISNAFVAKLTDTGPTGSFAWAQRAGGANEDYAYALGIGGSSIYVAGIFASSTANFGTTTLTNASANIADVFVAKLTDAGSTGSFAWAQRAGGTGEEIAKALVVSGTNVYVAGYFQSPISGFGTITLSNPTSSPLGFLATLTDPTLTATTTSQALAPGQLYPNPAHGTASLRLPAGTAPAPLTLTDALGRAVRHYPAPAGTEAALDLRGLPAGLYLLLGAGLAQRLAVE